MGNNPDPGWTSTIIFNNNFLGKKYSIIYCFVADLDPGSGIRCFFLQVLDPGWKRTVSENWCQLSPGIRTWIHHSVNWFMSSYSLSCQMSNYKSYKQVKYMYGLRILSQFVTFTIKILIRKTGSVWVIVEPSVFWIRKQVLKLFLYHMLKLKIK